MRCRRSSARPCSAPSRDDSACDDEVDDASSDDHDAVQLRVDKAKAYAKAQHDALENYVRKQAQDKLDSDERIASNVPSEADRNLLEDHRTRCCEQYARALRVRADRADDALLRESNEHYRVNAEAFDSFIREHEELNARAKKECSAREANGEDARDVRARWEQFERYGCCGALDDAFFDPRNG
jgi:hypothetical protein